MAKIKRTLESVKKEAKKYKTRSEFCVGSSGAYNWAWKNGFLDKVCSNMKEVIIWDLELVKKEVKKYKTRKEFKLGSQGAYNWAWKNGFLDKVCSHMPEFANQNRREQKYQKQIFNKLKINYKNLDIKMEVKIPKRDNEHGRIDFLIKNPENNRFIGLELKHTESSWTKKIIKKQLNKYKRSFRERKGFKGIYLINEQTSIANIDKIIKKII